MPSPAQKKQDQIDLLVGPVLEAIPAGERVFAESLIRQCVEDLSADDLRDADPRHLAGMIASLLGWIAVREEPRRPKIRIFTPQDEGKTWAFDHTVIEILTTDMPFLVDSVTGELRRRDLTIHLVLHPQLNSRRDAAGRLLALEPAGTKGEGIGLESLMQLQVDHLSSEEEKADLARTLEAILAEVDAVVGDFRPMKDACLKAIQFLARHKPPVPAAELDETVEFLEWIADDHFTFLGTIEYDLESRDGQDFMVPDRRTGLGLFKVPPAEGGEPALPAETHPVRRRDEHLVVISKSDRQSRVHRPVHMDVIALKRFAYTTGAIDGEIHFVGLFTSMAYNIAAREIPLVRHKVQQVVARTGFLPNSHDAKALRHIVEEYPRDELFQTSEDDLYAFALRILELQLRPRLALLVRRDDQERFIACMVYVPRERHSTDVRRRMESILEEVFAGKVTASFSRISDRPIAQVQIIIQTTPGQIPAYDVEEVEERLTEAIKTWEDQLRDHLEAESGDDGGRQIWRRYVGAFPESYKQYVPPVFAPLDIPLIEQALRDGKLAVRLYRVEGASSENFHLRTIEVGHHLPLSDILPMLENMGLQVLTENPFEVQPAGVSQPVWVRDFEVLGQGSARLDENLDHERFAATFRRIYRGEVENDGLNKLVLNANLTWRQVVILRAYFKYLRQIGRAFTAGYTVQTLARHGGLVNLLVRLFEQRFDPAASESRGEREQALCTEILAGLEQVKSLDEDTTLRRFLNLVQSTLRTNYYQAGEDGKPKSYLSLKLDSAKVRDLPKPRPMFEVFVYSPRVEAIHLRGGKVARGGIRWSDRQEDFRTEVLGLVKSQMVKNAVIVPVGAKGGFVVKRPPVGGGRDEMQREGIECYKTLVRGLLDITDNYRGADIVPPPDVVRHDADDPYLVVAADKGTATFSDIANGVAAEYGFWLGDAFASGGSLGYDHKGIAITARGAWVSVERHFREMGKNISQETFSCVGVGDMAGDVFGNGMLRTPTTRLLGAFNHLHIFVDPDPDPARTFAERQRLFDLPRSTWNDYDRTLLSEGGDIFERSAKQVTLSPQVQARFNLPSATATPNELIRALLKAEIDLLFFGGIGTYVKAESETDGDVGDRANDELRIDGKDLRAKVIGEGANLGMTQLGRVEYSLGGGRLNTDFIDNSGGVDCSDHEVNIKIALGAAKENGTLDEPGRQSLLVAMTGEVADLVLRDNYLQSQAISLVAHAGLRLLDGQAKLMRDLEKADRLDRRIEYLPSDGELEERRAAGKGLTRPEIAILLAYTKMATYDDLLASDLPDDPALLEDLLRYFPRPMQEQQRAAIEGHRLRREIIATHAANSMVNRVGPSFVARMREETGRRTHEVAWAYIAARDVFDLRSVWEEIEALDNVVPANQQTLMMVDTVDLINAVTRWFLRKGGRSTEIAAARQRYEDAITVVAAQIEEFLPPSARKLVTKRRAQLIEKKVPEGLAARIATMPILPAACDVAYCAQNSTTDTGGQVDVDQVARVYFQVGERFGFDRMVRAAEKLGGDSPFQDAAVYAILDDLAQHQTALTLAVLDHGKGKSAKAAIDALIASRKEPAARLDQNLDDFGRAAHIDLAMLTLAERSLRRLIA